MAPSTDPFLPPTPPDPPKKDDTIPTSNNSQTCLVCEKNLGPLELSAAIRFHFDCRKCAICGHEIPNTELCEKSWADYGKILHTGCAERELWEDFRKKDIPITQNHVNLINKKICEVRQPLDLQNLEQFYSLLRDLQQCAANVKVLIDRTKDRQKVEIAEDYREKQERTRVEKVTATRIEEEKKIRLQEERANPALRDRRKAVEGLMGLGMSRETAEAMIPQVRAN